MNIIKLISRYVLAGVVLAGCAVGGLQTSAHANGNPGLTIFSGVDRKDILDYYLQFGGRPRQTDRYKLYIPSKKLPQGAASFFISYPEYFDGQFDKQQMEVRVKGKAVPLKDVAVDKESRIIELTLEKAIDPNTSVEVVFSNVKNPNFGTYYFVCDVLASGNIPVRLYVGTWILDIEN
ncbi:MAG: hypothetical protein N5P05_000814 [Chroococcopsis gigantea SAG 12.99]|jgi:hypothetical protein|nr:DUF2808 domain-containing protein [Chlorogloea purpurea SAG 13.99]MDV2999208.1 hypothetical protein [Chroococcopsis gigantea SAG 12.99]